MNCEISGNYYEIFGNYYVQKSHLIHFKTNSNY